MLRRGDERLLSLLVLFWHHCRVHGLMKRLFVVKSWMLSSAVRKMTLLVASLSIALALSLPVQAANLRHTLNTSATYPCGQPIAIKQADYNTPPLFQGMLPEAIQVSLLVENIYDLDMTDTTFRANGFVSLSWSNRVHQWMADNKLTAVDLVSFPNITNYADFNTEMTTAQPYQDGPDRYHASISFDGMFYIPSLDLRFSPFNNMRLPVYLELKQEVMTANNAQLVYRRFSPATSDGEFIGLNGFRLQVTTCQQELYAYADTEALNARTSSMGDAYSRVNVAVIYRSDFASEIFNWVLPIILIVAVASISPRLVGSVDNVRLALPATSILALVFIQTSYRQTIPPLPYPTFLDLFIICAFANALVILHINVFACNGLELRRTLRVGGSRHFRRYLYKSYHFGKTVSNYSLIFTFASIPLCSLISFLL